MTIWNEYVQERTDEEVVAVYPDGIHAMLAETLESRGYDMCVATSDELDHSLTEAVLDDTDVLIWWGHKAHEVVEDAVVERVCEHAYDGMGFVPSHSAHSSKVFKRLMGTPHSLRYRESGERERVQVADSGHSIADGLDESFVVPETEMHGELFVVPGSDRLVFVSWFEDGEVFRSGCCYRRGSGRVFYFRPGHETYPVYEVPVMREVLDNAVGWAAVGGDKVVLTANRAVDPIE